MKNPETIKQMYVLLRNLQQNRKYSKDHTFFERKYLPKLFDPYKVSNKKLN